MLRYSLFIKLISNRVKYGTMLPQYSLDCVGNAYDTPSVRNITQTSMICKQDMNAFFMPLNVPQYEEMLDTKYFKLSDLTQCLKVDVIYLNNVCYKRIWSNNTIIEISEINRASEDIGSILFVKPQCV